MLPHHSKSKLCHPVERNKSLGTSKLPFQLCRKIVVDKYKLPSNFGSRYCIKRVIVPDSMLEVCFGVGIATV
jgi:hypothetical protein